MSDISHRERGSVRRYSVLADRQDEPDVARAAAPGAIRFALAHPRVAGALVGAATADQIAENVRAVA